MATDIATLGIKVDASQAADGKIKLEELAKAGDKAQASAKGLGTAASALNGGLASTTGAANAAKTSVGGLGDSVDRTRTKTQQTTTATEDLAERISRLKASVDPLGVALDRNNAEMAEASALFAKGAISADVYANSMRMLSARSTELAARQEILNARMLGGSSASRLSANEALNLSRQFADIGVTAAMGMNPLMILIQQGPQIADIMKTSGLGWRDMAKEMLVFFKILEPVPAANAAVSASNTAVTTTAMAAAAAEQRLGVAFDRTTAAATANAAANGNVAAMNAANVVQLDNVGRTVTRMGPLLTKGGPFVIGLAAIAGGFAFIANEAEKGLGDVQAEFGFTEEQMERLEEAGIETGYTIGDVMSATAATIGNVFEEEIEAVKDKFADWFGFVSRESGGASRAIIVNFIAALQTIKDEWDTLPDAIGASMWEAVRRAKDGMNQLFTIRNEETGATWQPFDVPNADANPYDTGAAERMQQAYLRNRAEADAEFGGEIENARKDRTREGAGEPGTSRAKRASRPRQSDEERDWERALEGAREYVKSLREASDEIGQNQFEVKRLGTAREAAELSAAAAAVGTAEAMRLAAELTAQMNAETEAWIETTNSEAIRQFREELRDQADALQYENQMIGMNAEERARAIADREIHLRVLELERQGHYDLAEAIAVERGALIDLAGARGRSEDAIDNANRVAQAHRDVADAVRDATSSFGELFGTAGEGYSNLLNTIFDFQAGQEEANARIIEIEQRRNEQGELSQQDEFERNRILMQQRQDQIAIYGDMLGAAKTFFKEGSTGFRVLEAAERAYRIFQFAMQIRAMFMDKAATTSSVANSGARAAADGVAAIAKAIASLPFPLNIAAGAATAAALVAFGVKIFGGGGKGKGAASSATKAVDEYSGPRDEYGAPTSSYSVLKPGHTTVAGTGANDNRNSAPAANVGTGGSFRGGDLIIQGGADRRSVEELQGTFNQWSRKTVEDARRAAAQDRLTESSRQRIGGS